MIDNNVVERARKADVIAFFEQRNGFTFAHRGGTYRCRQHPSLAVKDDRLSWFWHSKGIGGYGALDYLVKAENMPFRKAVEAVTGIAPITAPPQQETVPPRAFMLPPKAGISLRLYDYLCNKRGIDIDIVNALIQKEVLYEDKRRNVVFVGHDEQGKARFASVRGTYGDYRGDCAGSDKRYGFTMKACMPSERLYIFESPIDAMSHASLENAATGDAGAWEQHNRLSLAGTSDTAIPFFLNQHPTVKKLVFCLDNDPAGRKASVDLTRKYHGRVIHNRVIHTWIKPPVGKDINEDLQALTARIRAERRIKPLRNDVEI